MVSNYAGCHNDVETPIDVGNHGVLFLNSHISEKDVTDGLSHTIYVGEKLGDEQDLGWMSGTRATLRNAGTPLGWGAEAANAAGSANRPSRPPAAICGSADSPPSTRRSATSSSATARPTRSACIPISKVLQQLANRADGKLLERGPTRDK